MENERGRFSVKFETKGHEIDAATYGAVLVNAVVLIDEITNEVEGFGKFNVKVIAEKKGSFCTDIVLQAGSAIGITSSMITPDNVLAAKAIASKVVSYLGKGLDLVKKLGGESPKSITQNGDKTIVVTGNGNTVNVDNSVTNVFLNNPKAQGAVSNIFSELGDHPEINGMEVLDEKDEKIFDSPKADFPKLAAKITKTVVKKRVRTVKATLTPIRQSFDEKRKSDFIYAGNSITAQIADENFWKRVDADEPFAKSDKLVVKLQIHEELIEDLNAYKIKSYVVTELIDHKGTSQQTVLFEVAGDKPKAKSPNKKMLKK